MIQEQHCLKDIKIIDDLVYGEYHSKLIGNSEIKDESKIPYDILLERKYLKNIQIEDDKFSIRENLLQRPEPLYIQNIQNRINSVINNYINIINERLYNDSSSPSLPTSSLSESDDSIIKLIRWHPQFNYLAVVNRHDVVYIYNFQNLENSMNGISIGKPIVLYFEFQSGVKDLQWKLNYPLTLALASDNGIILWEIDLNDFDNVSSSTTTTTTATDTTSTINSTFRSTQLKSLAPSKTSSTILNYPYFRVSTITWSKSGLSIIAGSKEYNYIVVWDIPSKVPTFIARHGGSTLLSTNSTGNLVLSCSGKSSFRIYTLSNWTYESKEWKTSQLQTASWSPSGEYLAIGSTDKIMFLQCENNPLESVGELRHIERTTQERITYKLPDPNGGIDISKEIRIAGHIKSLVWSPDGQRIAVLFYKGLMDQSNPINESVIAIYRVKLHPKFEVTPRGYLKRQGITKIQNISFIPNYPKGSLLSASYFDGTISFFPLIYKHKQHEI